jgi:hypothetical protein
VKRTFSSLSIEDAMQLVPAGRFSPWDIDVPPRAPSDFLKEDLRRLRSFDLVSSEPAKMLIIDDLLTEVVPDYPRLKVWKGAALETDALRGVADYLIAPDLAYLATPILCVAEAKRDDFVQGRTQCVAEMVACRWKNRQGAHETDVFGIVSNGQTWQFYRLTQAGAILETPPYVVSDLPRLLGALDYLCGECARAVSGPDGSDYGAQPR